MPIPTGFNNTVRLVSATPVVAADINTELATQNSAGYSMTSLVFIDSDNAALLFVKQDATYAEIGPQKVNLVAASQAAIDADKATEIATGYWPTGMFVTPGGDLLICYQQLEVIAP